MTTPFQTTGYLADPKVAAAVSGVLDAGAKAASTPYPQYTATTAAQYANYVPSLVATRSPDQVTAQQGLSDLQGYTTGFTNQAVNYAKNAAAPIQNQGVGQNQINQYMSPYLNNVVNSAMQNINETNNQQQQQLMGNAVSKGAWGGDRGSIAQAALARQQNLSNNATLSNLLNTGYGTALGEANVQQQADLNTQLYNRQLQNAAAAQMQNLGTTSQNSQIAQLQAQYNMGAGEQQQQQNELSAAYQQYLNNSQYPYNQLNWYANLISGAPAALGGQTVATIPQPSTVNAIGGLATTVAGMDLKGMFGGSTPVKRGGAIRPNYASGGRMGFADAGAAVNPSIQAYNNYVNAARSGTASKGDLRDLYNIMRASQRGNSGFYGDAAGGVTGGVAPLGGVVTDYPLKPDTGLNPDQVTTITDTKTNTPTTIANTAGQAGNTTSAAITAAGGVLALLAKLLGGGGGGQGSGTKPGSTGNKSNPSNQNLSQDQQDALNEKAEIVADKIVLLEASDLKNTNPDEYKRQMNDLVNEANSLSKQGAVTEKADSGESAADRAAAIREEGKANPANAWAKENGLAPNGVAPVSGTPNATFNPEDKANAAYVPPPKQKSDLENQNVNVAGLEGVLPVSLIQPENAVQFAKNNGLEKASYDELKAMGLREDAIQAIMKESQSVDNAKPLDAAEIAMQPSQNGVSPTDPASNPVYQQYINMGFTPDEARSAISANTSAADIRSAAPTQTAQVEQPIQTTPVDNNNIKYASNNTLDSLKGVYNSNISGINDAQTKYLDSLQTQYDTAKSTYGSQYDQALNTLQQNYAGAKADLQDKYNTYENGYTANYQAAVSKLDQQYQGAVGNLNNSYQAAVTRLGPEPSEKMEMTNAQKYVAGIENGTINPAVGAYGYKGYGGIKGQDPAVNNAYAEMVAYSTANNKRMSEYGDYMQNRHNPNYDAWNAANDQLEAKIEAARQKYEAENAALHEKAAEAYKNGLAPNQDTYAQAQAAMEDKFNQSRSSAQEQYNNYIDSLQGSYAQQQQDAYDKFGSARGSAQDWYDQSQQQADKYYGDMYKNQNQDLMQNYNTSNIDSMPSINQSSIGKTFDVGDIEKYVPAAPITFESVGNYNPQYDSEFGKSDFAAPQPMTWETANFNNTGVNTEFNAPEIKTDWNTDIYNAPDTTTPTDWNTGPQTDWVDYNPKSEIVYPDYQTNFEDFEVKRGGRITRQHRATGGANTLSGPAAPYVGVAPITMDYGLSTQENLKNLAQNNLGSGVLPITPGQEALSSAYLFGGQ